MPQIVLTDLPTPTAVAQLGWGNQSFTPGYAAAPRARARSPSSFVKRPTRGHRRAGRGAGHSFTPVYRTDGSSWTWRAERGGSLPMPVPSAPRRWREPRSEISTSAVARRAGPKNQGDIDTSGYGCGRHRHAWLREPDTRASRDRPGPPAGHGDWRVRQIGEDSAGGCCVPLRWQSGCWG